MRRRKTYRTMWLPLFVAVFAATPLRAVEAPTNSPSKKDLSLNNRYIFQNLLAAYKNSRDVAEESEDYKKRVSGFSAAGNKFLVSIKKISAPVTAMHERFTEYLYATSNMPVSSEITLFRAESPESPVGSVDWVGRINGLTIDGLLDNLHISDFESEYAGVNAMMDVSRELIVRNPSSANPNDLDNARRSVVGFGFKKKYGYLAKKTVTDSSVYKSDSWFAKRHVVAQNAAVKAIASAEARNIEAEIETLPSMLLMRDAVTGEGQSARSISENAQALVRNRLAADLRGIETQQAAVGVAGQILMSKLTGVDNTVYQTAGQVYILEELAGKLRDRIPVRTEEEDDDDEEEEL